MTSSKGGLDHDASPRDGKRPGKLDQVVLVFQGGGALGAYQAGVYEALHEAGIEPDWVIGTSIGAINASLIAGNTVENRLNRLEAFWSRVEQNADLDFWSALPFVGRMLPNWTATSQGIPGFFRPNPLAFLGLNVPLAPDAAGYYSTAPLEKTLREFVDFELLGHGATRLTVGAAAVRTSKMHYFDTRNEKLNVRHIMASGALPPAFPPVRIDGELYWDGGILSNTPIEAVLDDNPRRNSLIFGVNIWPPEGEEPNSMWDVMHRQKDVQFSSRTESHMMRQRQIHRLRHIIAELANRIPADQREDPEIRQMAAYGCLTQMHVVRLLAPSLANEDHTKDIDFSRQGIAKRWQAGLHDTRKAIAEAAWEREVDPMEGFYLHEDHSAPATGG